MSGHPLDRPVWNALTGRQSAFAVGSDAAWRLREDVGLFAAVPDFEFDALADLCPKGGMIGTLEIAAHAAPRGLIIIRQALGHQMVATSIHPIPAEFQILPLGDDDAREMLALATLTEPGPFFANTHRLGSFIGVRIDGRLVAMAGERLHVGGFHEVSGVCTHPDCRGQGYAGTLMSLIATRMIARGETPFLHTYADNGGAIALYEKLGFRFRREIFYTTMTRT